MKHIKAALNKTDWVLLQQQRITLAEVIGEQGGYYNEEHLEGLQNWIDTIYDAAIEDKITVEL